MHRGDKAVLRLTTGLGLAVFVAYGLALQAPFVVCIMAVLVLCKPGPPLPMVKAVVIAVVFAGLVAAGVLMVPLLEHYAAAGLLLTAVVLFVLFYRRPAARQPADHGARAGVHADPGGRRAGAGVDSGSQPDAGGRRARRGCGQRGIERRLSRPAGTCFRGRGGSGPTARARAGSPGAAR